MQPVQGPAPSASLPVIGAGPVPAHPRGANGGTSARLAPAPPLAVMAASVSPRTCVNSDSCVGPVYPPAPSTPIDVSVLRRLAAPAAPPDLLHTVLHRLPHGADVGFTGPAQSSSRPNNASTRARPDAVTAAIRTEVARGHTVGPFDQPPKTPFRCNPLGAGRNPTAPSVSS